MIAFPGLLNESDRQRRLTTNDRNDITAIFLDLLTGFLAPRRSHFPATPVAERLRAAGMGSSDHRTFDIRSDLLEEFSNAFIEYTRGRHCPAWAQDAVFLVFLQGTKALTHFTLTGNSDADLEEEEMSWAAFTQTLNYSEEELRRSFFVDVALEVQGLDSAQVMTWYEPAHAKLLAFAHEASLSKAQNWTKDTSAFFVHQHAGLDLVAGYKFHSNGKVLNHRGDVAVEALSHAYCTDKAATAIASERLRGDHLSAKTIFQGYCYGKGAMERALRRFDNLGVILQECSQVKQVGAARLEVRLRAEYARDKMMDGMPEQEVLDCVISIEADYMWSGSSLSSEIVCN